jgi:bifunctional DNase/RNase
MPGKNRPVLLIIAVLLLVTIGLQAYSNQQLFIQPAANETILHVQSNLSELLSLDGYEKVNASIPSPGIIVVSTECLKIPMTTDLYQSESIQNGIDGITTARPNSHDIFAGTVKNFGIEVLFVKVYEMRDQMYFSKIIMRKDGSYLSMEARPSDATAIAVRMNAPVYFKKSLLVSGERVC